MYIVIYISTVLFFLKFVYLNAEQLVQRLLW